ncbi:hypothetical protein LTR91_003837 [Friedmanniomyces endolithicus]|uniref:4-hydroxy-2-oxoglutarate aldolase, mitochondrial n=1 Tax=Friedmanniomyces endolithicus TaxID=329885 RepID=A0AAN6QYD1_9PEZI|nr:hypothetical protein LTR35_007291 [Friedmanniomyces endolithicus]KAK0297395.1 hypothetical protein LTS00_004118 [Friedmanniomyces endolithicus]KAK0927355.1 hypothetical protein LTR57_003518 [Friedmanniomyces endolithicus]KAK0959784.1 hypothetical protein LTS01_021246 [Friedmanniomyces endolithicus]KAK1005912.1 hypothetical protein LTR91_003837 [Friedmanniomyces endolithicus]
MNGHKSPVPPPGVWAPAITFFNPDTDELDLAAQTRYYKYLSQHLTGLVILGTNAETFLLTREERAALLKCAREAVGEGYPIMAGVGGHSTKQVLEFIQDAAEAKADYVLVLPCAYFGKATTAKVITNFYDEVAAKSPLPIVIYNFPGVTNGIDLDSDLIASLATAHPGKIVGVKLTCASVAKITRLAASLPSTTFSIYGGQSDFLLGGLASGSAGCIAAFANVFPKTIKRIYELWVEGKQGEAMKMHRTAALAETVCKGGIAHTKFAAGSTSARSAGVEGWEGLVGPRRPYEGLGEGEREKVRGRIGEMVKIEDSL